MFNLNKNSYFIALRGISNSIRLLIDERQFLLKNIVSFRISSAVSAYRFPIGLRVCALRRRTESNL